MSLKRPWVGHHYHATHSGYSRGVSILVHKSLNFELLDIKIDPEGRYILLHAILDTVEMVIVGVYLPPPANLLLLNTIVSLLYFNIPLNPSLDRMFADPATDSALSRWARLFGLEDVWRWKHPSDRMFTCHSLSQNMLSRIDLLYASVNMLPKIKEIEILPCGISDHSPLLCSIQATTPQSDRLWRLSRYCIANPTLEIEMAKNIKEFWRLNAGSATLGNVWDAFKAYIRGCYLSSIARERRNDRLA